MNEIPNQPFSTDKEDDRRQTASNSEPVWTYRGYQLRSSDFTTAMVHFFRAEISRANIWRQRLDATTNWAVITTGAAITLAFNPGGYHGVIILNTLLITMFLYIEARRYRYYELWSYRVRLIETDFYAAMLVPPFHPAPDWAESLAENLLHPDFPISVWEALGRRLRRNYLWIYLILGVSWVTKVAIFPFTAHSIKDLFLRASIGSLPGEVVFSLGVVFYTAILLLALLTTSLQQASGEVLPRYLTEHKAVPFWQRGREMDAERLQTKPWFRSGRRRKQLVALIITDQAKAISDKILQDMRRGVTALNGTGMYTGKPHQVLMCALTITEVNQLKSLVRETDKKAFVMVMPAQEILGKGFVPLDLRESDL